MQDPLKQGLKRRNEADSFRVLCDSNARSIKTRIETISAVCCHAWTVWNSNARSIKTRIETTYRGTITDYIPIRMQDPLKQGLKLQIFAFDSAEVFIRMQDPLKQGLKH